MKKIKIVLFVLALGGALSVSCKKDDETDSTPYLNGMMVFDAPYYARVGEKVTVTPYGPYHPEGGNLKVYAYGSGGITVDLPDTVIVTKGKLENGDVHFTFTMPDSLDIFTMTCCAAADGYYSRTASLEIAVVSPEIGATLKGNGIDTQDEAIIDDRTDDPAGERTYYYETIGDLDWFRLNLAYTDLGLPFYLCDVMSYIYGRFYTYDEALEACPDGWRLPTEEEWISLGKVITGEAVQPGETIYGAAGELMADVYMNGKKMWEFWPDVKITNNTLLAFLPAGYVDVSGDSPKFSGDNEYAAFWTATLAEDDKAYYRYINVNKPDIYSGMADRESLALSVRCVRETDTTGDQ